jgi:hypothetical protein
LSIEYQPGGAEDHDRAHDGRLIRRILLARILDAGDNSETREHDSAGDDPLPGHKH